MSGTVKRVTTRHARIELEPGEWLDQPESFGSSGLEATLYKDGLNGTPMADGCHDMKLKRIVEK